METEGREPPPGHKGLGLVPVVDELLGADVFFVVFNVERNFLVLKKNYKSLFSVTKTSLSVSETIFIIKQHL